jgi:dihydroxy-acid dehydratase
MITLDAENGVIDIEVSADDLAARAKDWKGPERSFQSGYLWKYANEVGPARTGAVTQPGGSAEVVCYADI